MVLEKVSVFSDPDTINQCIHEIIQKRDELDKILTSFTEEYNVEEDQILEQLSPVMPLIELTNYSLCHQKNIFPSNIIINLVVKQLEAYHLEMSNHSKRVVLYMMHLTNYFNITDDVPYLQGAYLHDIGKLFIPSSILNKPDVLTQREFETIKQHSILGYHLSKLIPGISQVALNIILYHHERWDGSGYPKGLKEEEIPFEARMFAVIDTFDALVSDRPYKEKFSFDIAMDYLIRHKGTLFDPKVVDAFVSFKDYFETLLQTR